MIDVDTGEWYAILNIVGRAFHRNSSGDNSIASQFIGPIDKNGNDMLSERFKEILKKRVSAMRTVVATLVMAECTALGIRMDDPIVKDFASSILSSVKACTVDSGCLCLYQHKVCPRYHLCVTDGSPLSFRADNVLKTQTMQKHYDAHRATTRQTRRVQRYYEGTIDFSGGAYGVVEGSEKRRLEMERNEEGKELVCAIDKPGEDNSDLQLQLRWYKLELTERELRVKELELQMRERELTKNENPKARHVGTFHSQVMKIV